MLGAADRRLCAVVAQVPSLSGHQHDIQSQPSVRDGSSMITYPRGSVYLKYLLFGFLRSLTGSAFSTPVLLFPELGCLPSHTATPKRNRVLPSA